MNMRKVYIYPKEEEEQINRQFGYTQEDYDNYVYGAELHNKYGSCPSLFGKEYSDSCR